MCGGSIDDCLHWLNIASLFWCISITYNVLTDCNQRSPMQEAFERTQTDSAHTIRLYPRILSLNYGLPLAITTNYIIRNLRTIPLRTVFYLCLYLHGTQSNESDCSLWLTCRTVESLQGKFTTNREYRDRKFTYRRTHSHRSGWSCVRKISNSSQSTVSSVRFILLVRKKQ